MSLGAAATWLAESESPHPLSLLLVSLFELKAQFFYSVALNCFLLLIFFTFLDLSSVFFDCCLIHPVPKVGAGGGPLLCLLVFFSMGPGRSTGTTTRVGSCTPGTSPGQHSPHRLWPQALLPLHTSHTWLFVLCMGSIPSSCPDQRLSAPPTLTLLSLKTLQGPRGCVGGADPRLTRHSHEASPPHAPHHTPGPPAKGRGRKR